MLRTNVLLVGLLLFLSTPAPAESAPDPWSFFQKLLEEAGMDYERPPGYAELEPVPNEVLAYPYRVKNEATGVEIRYLVIPIRRIQIDYDDPHASAPEPDHIFSLLFPSLLTQLAADGRYREKEYPGQEARRLFNAEWAAAGVFTPNPRFAPYAHGLMVAMHRIGRADAFEIFLANDLEALKDAVLKHQSSLRFR